MSIGNSLYQAISDGDCNMIDLLLAGKDVNLKTEWDKWNLLHIALDNLTEAPKPHVIRHLISLGVDVNAKDRCGWTPLHFAARTKCPADQESLLIASVRLLIDAGADVNAKDDEGITPLHRSIFTYPWHSELLEVMLVAGAKPTDIFRRVINAVTGPDKQMVLDLLAKYHPN